MKTRIFYCFLLLFPTFFTGAQNIPGKAYMHLEGSLGEKGRMVINLVKTNDSLYADYSTGDGIYRTLYGKCQQDGSFWMKEMFNDKGPSFRGKFTSRSTMAGTWEAAEGEKRQQVQLSETYPAGTIRLNLYYNKSFRPITNEKGAPRAEILQSLLIPATTGTPRVSDTLRRVMLNAFSGKKYTRPDPEWVIATQQLLFFDNYINSNESIYKKGEPGPSFNWFLWKAMHILFNGSDILSFYVFNYGFTGGAHGLETQDNTVADTRTGRKIALEELLKDGYEPGLARLLTNKLKQVSGLPGDAKLTDHGWFVDEVEPNSNFFLTDGGIGFYYNPYDIAPYSNGSTEIFLSFDELKTVLRADGIITRLVR